MKYENTVCLAFEGQGIGAVGSYPGSLRGGLRCALFTRPLSGQPRQFGETGHIYARHVRPRGMAAHLYHSDSFSGPRFAFAGQRSRVFIHTSCLAGPALVPSDKAYNLWQIGRGAGNGGFAVLWRAGRARPALPDRERST